jgi:hypothetical protein
MGKRDTVYDVIRDIKRYGLGYIKSKATRDQIAAIDKDISITWDKEDQLYIARYNPISRR